MEFSTTEQELYDFIKKEGLVSIDTISKLGNKYLGAIGKLIQTEKIDKITKQEGTGYNIKNVKYYKIREEKDNVES